ncbi:kinase-like protein [Xylariaceae sp. FL1272]|nr:kinase-like protein [Xylariaceae sp. FL1272]
MTDERTHEINCLADLDGRISFYPHSDPGNWTSAFWKIYDDHAVYYGEIRKEFEEVAIDEIGPCLERVPDEDVYPLVPDGVVLTTAPLDALSHDGLYVKRPALGDYHNAILHSAIRDVFLAEAQTLEQLSTTPHESIMAYKGCIVSDGRLRGIVLQRYRTTLANYVRSGENSVDVDAIMARLREAVDHLHKLGLAHNDLNPNNIMMDDEDMPVVIDLGSCQPEGGRLMSGGSPGWSKSTWVSVMEHDLMALEVVREWLGDPGSHVV